MTAFLEGAACSVNQSSIFIFVRTLQQLFPNINVCIIFSEYTMINEKHKLVNGNSRNKERRK